MTKSEATSEMRLEGLDGSNPIGFLASVGLTAIAHSEFPDIRIGWKLTGYGWRPALIGCGGDEQIFSETLLQLLKSTSMAIFEIDKRMPFDVAKFSEALQDAQVSSSITERRDADLLAAMGTELYPDSRNGNFQDSRFRMVRSGDSAGQGLPFYVKTIHDSITLDHIQRALFRIWDYQDEGPSLRWDPIADQRYALRWKDPSKSKLADGPGTMLAVSRLAVEALRYFPTLMSRRQAETTGFQRIGRRDVYFVWPIWTPMISVDTMRSLVASPELGRSPLSHSSLARMGVEEVYRSQRIRQNQYYSNFSPAQPV